MQRLLPFILLVLLASCYEVEKERRLQPGDYRGTFEVMDNELLPFNFEVKGETLLNITNADEVIEVDEIIYRNDSVFIMFPYFETYFAATFNGNDLVGTYVEESRDRYVPFKAEFDNSNRFIVEEEETFVDVSGAWETVFSKGIAGDEYVAKGEFKQEGNKITGTFRTPTGDYRYLEGSVNGNQLLLSTFDTAHAFLFKATVTDSTIIDGMFYSGNHFKEPFEAKQNKDYSLPDANKLTFLKQGYDKLEFAFPDLEGNIVSLDDERFKDKVVLVQIMGSYCPNCLDESKFYTKYYEANKDKDLEIVALAFENAKTEEKAMQRITRMKDRLGITYPVLLAQYATNSKQKAQEKLPMLNHVLSYPTTIYIDKQGEVRKIHTGFSGPATGQNYLDFVSEFEEFVGRLVEE